MLHAKDVEELVKVKVKVFILCKVCLTCNDICMHVCMYVCMALMQGFHGA